MTRIIVVTLIATILSCIWLAMAMRADDRHRSGGLHELNLMAAFTIGGTIAACGVCFFLVAGFAFAIGEWDSFVGDTTGQSRVCLWDGYKYNCEYR